MRTILFSLFVLAFTVFASGTGHAQAADPGGGEDALQQQIDKISGQMQDLQDQQAAQGKRIADVEKRLGDLEDKLNQPGGANADDLKKLAEQVQEIDKKRQSDNEQI